MAKKSKQHGSVKIPRFIINTGKFLQMFSPDLTVKYVRFLFQKPINHKRPEVEKTLLDQAEISFLKIPEIKKKVAVYSWGDGNKKALIVHGWSGRATQMYKIINMLLDSGYTVISFDAPAHGKSSGSKTMMPEFIKTVEKIIEKYGTFDLGIGHSLGGITLLNIQAHLKAFKKLIVIGTPDSIYNIFHKFVDTLELKTEIADKLIAVFEKITGKSIYDFHGSTNARNITIPTMIIHDDDDMDVPVSDALKNYEQLKNGKIFRTKGLGHSRLLKNNTVINAIKEFIE
jgi:pimeloyl-ACP methyl ester carboxylesterase